MTRFTAQIAVLLAAVGISTAAGCELIVGGHHVPGTGGAGGGGGFAPTSSSGTGGATTSTGTGGKGGTGGTGGLGTGGTGGLGTGGMSTGGTGGMGTGGMGTGGAATGGTGGMGTGGMGTGGSPGGCTDPTQCPGTDTECQTRTCTAGVCGFSFTQSGTPTQAGQTKGDCLVTVCDGAGNTTTANDDADVFDDGNPCTDDTCNAGMPANKPSASGAPCSVGTGTLCDGNGACVECLADPDCTVTGFCSAQHTCVAPSCGDTVKNGTETDVDCGGGCAPCADNALCKVAADCTSGVCSGTPAKCQAPACNDTVKNGTESDVDCGGTCATKCGPGKGCAHDADCVGGQCSGTVCLPTCTDTVKNGGETDVDCGGPSCTKCSTGKTCAAGTDCQSGVCTGNVCQAPACNDTVKNGTETDVDCGGSCAAKCAAGLKCGGAADCASGVCSGGVCQAPSCSDNIKNGTETDVDCGGGCATKCATGKVCATGADCTSLVCQGNVCKAASCGDGVKSPGEGCDDGNKTNGDGCSSLCFTEAGFTCSGSPSVCSANCGDGIKASTEGCDDGNKTAGDGCSPTCTVESGFTCTGTVPSVCAANCGDGIKASTEACDDGNKTAGDGCSPTCTVESGFTCTGGGAGSCAPTCGDGLLKGSEQCDDGNKTNGDGCSSTCQKEAGFTCTGTPSTCTTTCGDGIKAGAEACDDGNKTNGDGCSATCTVESGYTCTGTTPSTCTTTCGDGVKAGAEACDDHNTADGDGCSSACTVESGYACTGTAPSTCAPICGDGLKVGAEGCDDGNKTNGDGCSATCAVETGYTCSGAPSACTSTCGDGVKASNEACDDHNTANGDGCSSTCTVESGYTCTGTAPSTCATTCGDGIKAGAEACDDHNTANGDGCSATCTVEAGFTCTGSAPTVCTAICGDGIKTASEPCDDGNLVDGDGCSSTCTVESGYTCNGSPSSCVAGCGDGIVAGGEQCDDGNLVSGDGCSAACVAEPGYACAGSPSICATVCGDGILAGGEQCDDGNANLGDGCAACAVEPGWLCLGSPSTCMAICGDGLMVGPETCDDTNAVSGDGCSSTCTTEPGYTCNGTPSTCTAVCGDGIKAGIEACDDGNTANNDGCTAGCTVEPGWTCTGVGAGSCKTTCGDGLKVGAEACDDQNAVSGDGCSSTCTVEAGWTCAGSSPTTCAAICGDGLRVGAEQCDDGNTANNDGCTSTCQIEQGFEIEPNGTIATANNFSTVSVAGKVNGRISSTSTVQDLDYYAFTIPTGYSGVLTAQTIDNWLGTLCSGNTMDTTITLLDAQGYKLVSNDDFGGNFCSKVVSIALPPGTYYAEMKGHSATATFNYTMQGTTQLLPCGNGTLEAGEQCDDGNTTNGDGCSSTCRLEYPAEPATDTSASCATAYGPYALTQAKPSVLVGGNIGSTTDQDWFQITIPAKADLKVETFDKYGPGSCALNIDTVIQVYKADCTTAVNTTAKDTGGINLCATLDPSVDTTLKGLAAGTYNIKVTRGTGTGVLSAFDYTVRATLVTLCGNGVKESTEGCDDGNLVNGDGCDNTCIFEAIQEPATDTSTSCATGYGPYTLSSVGSNVLVGGSINPVGDADWFKFTLTNYADLKLETFDAFGPSTCASIDTVMDLIAPDCTTLIKSQDQGGVGNCSKLDPATDTSVRHLAPGTYAVKVTDYLNDETINYRLQATLVSLCGNGVVEGSEQCDGGSTCGTDCMLIPVCGNGIKQSGEQCDDGNTTSGDGCSATCQWEQTPETESNNTCATANGPFAIPPPGSFGVMVSGSLNPPGTTSGDQDWFSFTVSNWADVKIETFDSTGPSSCASPVDTQIQLYKADCTTTVTTAQDQGGVGNCSKLDASGTSSQQASAMKHLAPGTYNLKVNGFGSTAYGYMVRANLVALCGNGVIEGSEQCDGGPGCAADCTLLVVCGNGVTQTGEQCDDGNTTSGDGCSATCQWETVNEVEPNDTTAAADTNAANNPQLLLNGNRNILGGISASTDKDIFKVVVATNNTVVRFETFDSSGTDCRTASPYSMASHNLRLLNSSGTTITSDTSTSGIGPCPELMYRLDAGTYYIQVDKTAALAAYFLQVRFMTDNGSEAEPNDTRPQANAMVGRSFQVFGDHTTTTDTDIYAITVPAGASIRAETIEGDTSETCESLGIDSTLTLFNSAGTSLGSDTDTGRGWCSQIDGTGSSPLNSFASKLPAGTYYLQVTSNSTTVSAANQFKYRLGVDIRY